MTGVKSIGCIAIQRCSNCATLIVFSLYASCCWAQTLIVDRVYQDACGPISCMVALRSLGFDVSLDELAKKCNWKEGNPVRFSDLQCVLDSYPNIECAAVKLTPSQLRTLLADGETVAILAARKNSLTVNHSVCAVGLENGKIEIIDYPELTVRVAFEDLGKYWDGGALVVRTSSWFRSSRNFLWAFPVCSLAALYFFRLRQSKERQTE